MRERGRGGGGNARTGRGSPEPQRTEARSTASQHDAQSSARTHRTVCTPCRRRRFVPHNLNVNVTSSYAATVTERRPASLQVTPATGAPPMLVRRSRSRQMIGSVQLPGAAASKVSPLSLVAGKPFRTTAWYLFPTSSGSRRISSRVAQAAAASAGRATPRPASGSVVAHRSGCCARVLGRTVSLATARRTQTQDAPSGASHVAVRACIIVRIHTRVCMSACVRARGRIRCS